MIACRFVPVPEINAPILMLSAIGDLLSIKKGGVFCNAGITSLIQGT
jgi:hypothetical protein